MRDLSLHILDIVQNSINAGASIISIDLRQRLIFAPIGNVLELTIIDNGTGMDSESVKKADDPFFTTRTSRRVGLGISLLKASAMKSEGVFKMNSQKNIGTEIIAAFSIDNIDRLPIGDLGETMITLISSNPDIHFNLILNSQKGVFKLDTTEINDSLNGVRITEFSVLGWLKEFIDEGIKNIFGGVLNEVNS